MHMRMYIRIYECMCGCACICTRCECMYVCTHVCMYTRIHLYAGVRVLVRAHLSKQSFAKVLFALAYLNLESTHALS